MDCTFFAILMKINIAKHIFFVLTSLLSKKCLSWTKKEISFYLYEDVLQPEEEVQLFFPFQIFYQIVLILNFILFL
jgi:hypothetical protein